MNYVTITDGSYEFTVSRSRFISFCYGVDGEEDVVNRLKALKKQYSDATHVCYAAIWDELGTLSRFSDDGEPSGTAGAPIMDAIKSAGLSKCLVAVVRYFGGTKLGTGGLTRAYRQAASGCLAAARKVRMGLCEIYFCTTDFATFRKLNGARISDVEYGSDVSFTYSCPVGESIEPLINRAGGKISIRKSDKPLFKEITETQNA